MPLDTRSPTTNMNDVRPFPPPALKLRANQNTIVNITAASPSPPMTPAIRLS